MRTLRYKYVPQAPVCLGYDVFIYRNSKRFFAIISCIEYGAIFKSNFSPIDIAFKNLHIKPPASEPTFYKVITLAHYT